MAAVEMDIDTVHPPMQSDGADDDLIDFDTDMVDQPVGGWTHVEVSTRAIQGDVSLEDIEHDNLSHHSQEAAKPTVSPEIDDLDLEAGSSPMDHKDPPTTQMDHDAQPVHAEDGDDPLTPKSYEQHNDDFVDLGEGIDDEGHSVDAPADDKSAHEIDYEVEDHEQEHSQGQVDERADGAGDAHEADIEADRAQHGVNDPEMETADVHHGATGHAEESDHDEINWNELEDHDGYEGSNVEDQNTPEEPDQAAIDDTEEAAESQYDAETKENDDEAGQDAVEDAEESDRPIASQYEEDEAENYGEVPEGDYEDEHETAGSQVAETAASLEETTSSPNSNFPAITVQYKGDEFPCFSTASEGFFTEISVLDDTMEALLSKFRAELVNEIPHEDELVFQVDELGLEFAESSLRDSLSSVTLRQILEIFDLLVKNQDPDSSRVLYTYLFTKPSTSKRLESLIDSATAGKGLDEVIHLFESPMPNSTSLLEVDPATHAYDEQLDEYNSPDAIVETHEGQLQDEDGHDEEATDDAGYSVLDGDHQANHEDHEHDVDAREDEGDEAEESAVEEAAEIGGDSFDEGTIPEGANENGKYTNTPPSDTYICFYPDFCLCTICGVEYSEDHDDQEAAFRAAAQPLQVLGEREVVDTPMESRSCHTDHFRTSSGFSVAFSRQEADEALQAQIDSESNPFLNLELDTEPNDEVGLEGEYGDKRSTRNDALETDGLHAANTSTTSTLRADDDAASINLDVGEIAADDPTATGAAVQALEEELEEIDWIEDTDADQEVPCTPSGTGKRGRIDDDELDAEDGKDVKRRRS